MKGQRAGKKSTDWVKPMDDLLRDRRPPSVNYTEATESEVLLPKRDTVRTGGLPAMMLFCCEESVSAGRLDAHVYHVTNGVEAVSRRVVRVVDDRAGSSKMTVGSANPEEAVATTASQMTHLGYVSEEGSSNVEAWLARSALSQPAEFFVLSPRTPTVE
jgi:hypothetical protein